MSCPKGVLILSLLTVCAPVAVIAADYPAACKLVQECIDQAVASDGTACLAAQPECNLEDFPSFQTVDRFAVSSGELADRSEANVATRLGLSSCSDAPTVRRCYVCYRAAIRPLRDRFYGKLFHGLLLNTAHLLHDEMNRVCPNIGN